MASSYRYYKEEVKEYLERKYNKESSILDVGAGEGTYYELLKGCFRNIDAVEIFKENIERYELENKYEKVYNEDIRDFRYKKYDIVIFGDVLEHLEIEEAQKVLEYARKRCREIIVAVPYMYKQGIIEGNIYEIHKQDDLTEEKVKERYPYLELLFGNKEYGYYVCKGDLIIN